MQQADGIRQFLDSLVMNESAAEPDDKIIGRQAIFTAEFLGD